MNYNELWDAFTKLSLNDQGRFVDAANQLVKFTNHTTLRAGAKVCFKHSKTGAVIDGVFVRMKQKYAEVSSNKNQYGIDMGHPMKWSVPPEMLRLVS